MPWAVSRPTEALLDIEKVRLFQEFYDRPRFGTFSWTAPGASVGANSSTVFTLSSIGPDIVSTVATGLRPGSPVCVSPPSVMPAQVSLYAFCSASDTAKIVIVNPTAGAVTPPPGIWGIMGVRV